MTASSPLPGAAQPLETVGATAANTAARVLIVAVTNATAETLLAAVRARAAAGPARFQLLLPDPAGHAELTRARRLESRAHGESILADALPLLSEAAGNDVEGFVSNRHDPMDAIEDTLSSAHVDEIILATVHHHLAEGLHVDLPRRVAHLGLPVTTVTAAEQVAAVV
ncbi:MAG: hypothetical protein JWM06_2085 [Actinomycetia bacterium]|jgi:hypothetical protein|nr:hypothetical protein [Actinomycetes bacterium]